MKRSPDEPDLSFLGFVLYAEARAAAQGEAQALARAASLYAAGFAGAAADAKEWAWEERATKTLEDRLVDMLERSAALSERELKKFEVRSATAEIETISLLDAARLQRISSSIALTLLKIRDARPPQVPVKVDYSRLTAEDLETIRQILLRAQVEIS